MATLNMLSRCGRPQQVLDLWQQHIQGRSNVKVDEVTFIRVLSACVALSSPQARAFGNTIVSHLQSRGQPIGIRVHNLILTMYTRCGSPYEALQYWKTEMNSTLNTVTGTCILLACAAAGQSTFEIGRQVHSMLSHQQVVKDKQLYNALLSFYARCGAGPGVVEAIWREMGQQKLLADTNTVASLLIVRCNQELRRTIDEVPHLNWDTASVSLLMTTLIHAGYPGLAIQVWKELSQEKSIKNDMVMLSLVLKACKEVGTAAIDTGMQVHSILEKEYSSSLDSTALWNSLLAMYTSCCPEKVLPLWVHQYCFI